MASGLAILVLLASIAFSGQNAAGRNSAAGGTQHLPSSTAAVGIRQAFNEFQHPQDSTRTKVWWFHGETRTTREGITADLEAFKEAGVGGVVYYDQVHGNGAGAFDAMSREWWDMLKFAAKEAKRLGLSFEINISNGYVAGGPWITKDMGMQQVCSSETFARGPMHLDADLPAPSKDSWFKNIAVLAFPVKPEFTKDVSFRGSIEFREAFTARSITYTAPKGRKSRIGAMNYPDGPAEKFYGMSYVDPPLAGILEVSDDGVNYRKICGLPTPGGVLGLAERTISFEPVTARYFRIAGDGSNPPAEFTSTVISSRPRTDRWQEKANYFSEFHDAGATPDYPEGTIDPASIIDITGKMSPDGHIVWDVPAGDWVIMRFASESTHGSTSHGRKNLMGLECDKMSRAAADLQWNSYAKRIIDTLSNISATAADGKIESLKPEGVTMDSHEAGPQNWTADFPGIFLSHNGYDIIPLLPAMRGYIIGSGQQTEKFLSDLRRTIADAVTDNYYGEFNRLCQAAGVKLTAQATGNQLSLGADNISAKRTVMKPQGEFWARDVNGSYDIIDCISAAHIYGRQIASGEAFTDAKYSDSPAKFKILADFSYASLLNEFVVCATAYQPDLDVVPGNVSGGRQYCLGRNNTFWPLSRPFWDYQARCAGMLRKGGPEVDLLIYIGNDPPVKTLAHLLPVIPEGYNFDTTGGDALFGSNDARQDNLSGIKCATVDSDGELVLSSGMRYRMLVIQRNVTLTGTERAMVEKWKSAGLPVFEAHGIYDTVPVGFAPDLGFRSAHKMDDCVRFGHRKLSDADVYFVYNHSKNAFSQEISIRSTYSRLYRLNPVDGSARMISCTPFNGGKYCRLELAPDESTFLIATDTSLPGSEPELISSPGNDSPAFVLDGKWKVQFGTRMGGPAEPVTFDSLTDWTKNADPRIRYYSGMARYSQTFRYTGPVSSSGSSSPDGGRRMLHFTGLQWPARVTLNGHAVGIVWCSPWEIDISKYLRRGRNTISIEVVNSLYNRMIGDESLEESKRFTHSDYPIVSKDTPLVPSGITGSIEIISGR